MWSRRRGGGFCSTLPARPAAPCPFANMMLQRGNLFEGQPAPDVGEVFEELLRHRGLRIERITSSPCPETGLYDQAGDEWVVLLTGRARLEVAGASVTLDTGDYLFIPARTPHRVLETSSDPRCTWLAVHLDAR
jgi:cupin 2 domain-containing protein